MQVLRNVIRTVRVLVSAKANRTKLARVLIRRPGVMAGIGASEIGELLSARVPAHLKLLAQLKVASIVQCEFCLDIGSSLAHYERFDPRKIQDLVTFETSDAYSPDEITVLRLAESLSAARPVVTDSLRAELNARFKPAQILELSSVIAREHERTRLYIGIDLPSSRFSTSDMCAVPRNQAP